MKKKAKKRSVKAWAVLDGENIAIYTHNPMLSYTEGPTLAISNEKGRLPSNHEYPEIPCTITYDLP